MEFEPQPTTPETVKQLMERVKEGRLSVHQAAAEIQHTSRQREERAVHGDFIVPPTDNDVAWVEIEYYRGTINYDEFLQLYYALETSYNL